LLTERLFPKFERKGGYGMARREGGLKKIDEARSGDWRHAMGGPRPLETLEQVLDPGLQEVRRLTDNELAEIIARECASKLGLLAARVQRERESWRTPARWSLVVALCSLAIAVSAFVRTL
jgi:hypothetical protein